MPAQSPRGYAVRMSLYFGAFFFPMGIYIPFFGVWLNYLGMTAEQIGLILTIPMVTRVVCTPFMAAIADKIGDRRLTLRIYSLTFGLSFALITLSGHVVWIALVMAISHIAQSAITPVADSLAMAGTRRYGIDYGKMRGLGSLAFVVASTLCGFLVQAMGAGIVAWVMVASNILHILLSISLPTDPRLIDNKRLSKGTKLNWAQLKQFGQLGFWIVIIAGCLVQGSHSLFYAFGTIYWREIGIASDTIGLLWSASVMAEVGLFLISKRMSGFLNWKRLLIVGAVFSIIRWFVFPLGLSETGYMLLQMMHAATFACSHLGMVYFIAEHVDDGLSGTAQGLYTMVMGLTMAIITSLSGVLYAQFEENSFYVMSAISAAALLLMFAARFFPIGQILADDDEPDQKIGDQPAGSAI